MSRLAALVGGDRQAALGLASLVIGTLILIAGLSGVLHGLVDRPAAHEVTATFRDTQQLRTGGQVRIDGSPAGKVDHISLDPGARQSTVTMKVEDDAGPLYADARAVLRWKTVLGGAFYVDLQRGTPSRGPLAPQGIPVQRTDGQVELDDVTSVFQGGARRGLRTLPNELAAALRDPNAPARMLRTLSHVAPDVTAGLRALRGRVPDRDLRALVRDTSRTLRALDQPRDDLRRLVAGVAATLQTTGARAADLRATIAGSPAVMRETDVTLARLSATLDLADPLLARLRDPAGDVGPTVAHLRPTVVDAADLLRRAIPLLRSLRPAAASLRVAARRGLPLVDRLRPSLDRLDDVILPMLSERDPGTTKSTAVMIGGTVAGLASGAGGQMDVNGHFIRFPATAGSSPVYSLPCQTYFANPDKRELIACQMLQEALKTYLSYSPLGPTPGTAGGPPPPARSRP